MTRFARGDDVFGKCLTGHQWRNGGAFAEFAAVPAIALVPDALQPHVRAGRGRSDLRVDCPAVVSPKAARCEQGHAVLVDGAGGGVGIFAVDRQGQRRARDRRRHDGASSRMIRSIGADHVIDHTRDDFTHRPERYDLIVDIPGNHPYSRTRRALTPTGHLTSSSATTASAPHAGAGSIVTHLHQAGCDLAVGAQDSQADYYNADEAPLAHRALRLGPGRQAHPRHRSHVHPQRGPDAIRYPPVRICTRQSRHHDVIAGAYACGGKQCERVVEAPLSHQRVVAEAMLEHRQ